MSSNIGFQYKTSNQVAQNQQTAHADAVMRQRAAELLMQFIDNYCNPYYKPMVRGTMRDEWFLKAVSQIRQRYLDPIKM